MAKDDALMIRGKKDEEDKPQIILPPLRTFVVTRMNPDPHEARPGRMEEITVHAHEMQFAGESVCFVEYRLLDGEPTAQMPRVFKHWIDVQEILRTNGKVH